MSLFTNIRGAMGALFKLGGPTGPQLKAPSASKLQARDTSDAAFIPVDVADASGVDAATTRRQVIGQVMSEGPTGGYASGAYQEVLPAADPFPTQVIWWTSAAKTAKIIQVDITRDASKKPTTVVYKVFADDGSTIQATVTDTVAYSGPFVTSVTRVLT